MRFELFDELQQLRKVLLGNQFVFGRRGGVGNIVGLLVFVVGDFDEKTGLVFAHQVDVDVFGNGNQPSIELEFGVVTGNFIECLRESFDGDVLGIGFVFGTFEHETINLVPIKIQQKSEGRLVAFFCFFYLSIYFQYTGFEKIFVMNTFNCVKISTISITGNQYITSFSFNFPAANPSVIQVNR